MSFKKRDYQTGYSGLTASNIATFLQRTLTASEQTLVGEIITEQERELCRATNRQFKTESTEYYEEFGSGHSKFMFFNHPIESISLIEVDGVDVTSNYTEGENYWILDEILVKFEVPIVSQNIYTGVKLTHTLRKFWGEDVVAHLKKMVAIEFLNSDNAGVGVSNFSFGDLNKIFNVSGFERQKEKLISFYANHNL